MSRSLRYVVVRSHLKFCLFSTVLAIAALYSLMGTLNDLLLKMKTSRDPLLQ
jgi:hypothetical protein